MKKGEYFRAARGSRFSAPRESSLIRLEKEIGRVATFPPWWVLLVYPDVNNL